MSEIVRRFFYRNLQNAVQIASKGFQWIGATNLISIGTTLAFHFFMLSWTVTFLIIALIAGILGFTAIAGVAASIAKILFIIFLVLFLISLISGGMRRTR